MAKTLLFKVADWMVDLAGIYIIINLVTGKAYVGQTNRFSRRYKEHCGFLRRDYHFNIHLFNAIKKYGIENFAYKIVEVVPDELSENREYMNSREKIWIDKIGYYNKSKEPGYFGVENGIAVTAWTMSGVKEQDFDSVTEASLVTGTHYTSILKAIAGKRITAGGRLWTRKGEVLVVKTRNSTKYRKLKRIVIETGEIFFYNTQKEAGVATNTDPRRISDCVHKKETSIHGNKWEGII